MSEECLAIPWTPEAREWGNLLGALATGSVCRELSLRQPSDAQRREVCRRAAGEVCTVAAALAEAPPGPDVGLDDLIEACNALARRVVGEVLGPLEEC